MPGEQDSLESVGDKYESYREHSKANPRCYTQTFIRTTCRVEDDAGSGLPTRKCERLIRKFEDCGRGLEELGSMQEETEDLNYTRSSLPFRGHMSECSASGQQAPLESHVGRALEEFREYAEELKYRTAGVLPGRAPILSGEYTQPPEFRPPVSMQLPWYSRLLHRQAQCSPGRQRPWERYKKDFQEV